MIFTFLNSNGVDITGTTVDIKLSNNIILELVVDGEGQAAPITGNILHNDKKIGEFSWSNVDGSSVIWYVGDGRPIYVQNGDKIRAIRTSSPTGEIAVTIKRIQPDVLNIDSLSRFIAGVSEFAPTSPPHNRLKDAMDYISTETALVHSTRESVNVRRIKEYLRNRGTLPTQESLIYGTSAQLQEALNTIVPPTVREIFDTWKLNSSFVYYPPGATIPPESEAAAWYWDDNIQAAVMPLNSNTFCTFISDELVDYYDHEVTVVSTSADDDWNGVILAFERGSDNINYSLSLTAANDGTNGTVPDIQPNLQLRYNFSKILKNISGDDIRGGWSNKTKRLKVSRRGDSFTVQSSRWNERPFDSSLTTTINLSEFPELARFKGPKQYGYCNISQPGSSFKDIKYFGGILRDTIIDATNNQVYRYRVGVGWELIPGITAQDVYGAPRALIGPDDKSYMLELDGTITRLN